jgi:hypothetical protein
MNVIHQAQLERHLDRKDTLDHDLNKAHVLICSTHCDKTMQNRIEEHPDHELIIQDDPTESLNKIKELMHDPIRAKHPSALLTEAMTRMPNIKQVENQELLDCACKEIQAVA